MRVRTSDDLAAVLREAEGVVEPSAGTHPPVGPVALRPGLRLVGRGPRTRILARFDPPDAP